MAGAQLVLLPGVGCVVGLCHCGNFAQGLRGWLACGVADVRLIMALLLAAELIALAFQQGRTTVHQPCCRASGFHMLWGLVWRGAVDC